MDLIRKNTGSVDRTYHVFHERYHYLYEARTQRTSIVMRNTLLLRNFLIVAALVVVNMESNGQVFISSEYERTWLNSLIPGLVDENGIMDTLHVGIANIDSTVCTLFIQEEYLSLSLDGLSYLSSLNYLRLIISVQAHQSGELSINALPNNLRRFYINSDYPIQLPSMPSIMDIFVISFGDYLELDDRSYCDINQMSDTIDFFDASDLRKLTWNGTPHFREFNSSNDYAYSGSIHLPSSTIDRAFIYGFSDLDSIDLRNSSIVYLEIIEWSTNSYNKMILSDNVDTINLAYNYGKIVSWPINLKSLTIIESDLGCIPNLPDNVSYLYISSAQIECLPNWPSMLDGENFYHNGTYGAGAQPIFCSVLNTDCPNSYPGISGSFFIDVDGNGVQGGSEFNPSGTYIHLQPGNVTVPSGADGYWEVGLAPGNYTITPSSSYPYVLSYAPGNHIANVPNMGDIDTDNHFAATLMPNIQDLRAWVYADPARPGFENRLFLNYQNYGTIPTNATLTLQWDTDQQWVGSSVTPSTVSGTTATWDLGTLAISDQGLLTVDLSTPATVPLGTPIEHTLTAGPVLGDETPMDNAALFSDVVVGSYDPNDKLLSPATMSPAQLQDPDARIEYTIRFQNTGTYLAERVVILDTLPEGLILESIQFLASSHANTWYLTNGVLHVIHNDIMLPDSTSDEPNSHGFIRFSIKPDPALLNGSTIANIAHIIFDFNEPIITPPAIFTVDLLANVTEMQRMAWSLWPNPTSDVLWVTISDARPHVRPFTVRDVTGRTVMTGSTTASGELSVGTLATGAYTLQLQGEGGVMRFVKE